MKQFIPRFYQHPNALLMRKATAVLFSTLWSGMTVGSCMQQAIAVSSNKTTIVNQGTYSFRTHADGPLVKGTTNTISIREDFGLIDPNGQILGCGGKPLADYTGFSVGLHEVKGKGLKGEMYGAPVKLTPTEVPDIPGNDIPLGITPNTTNQNPYPLNNTAKGRYSFLLDRGRGQIAVGRDYILVVNPPITETRYVQRQVKIEILSLETKGTQEVVSYRATSLDGLPIAPTGALQIKQTVVLIPNSEQIGLQLLAFQITGAMCNQNQIELTKTGDRASAAPGDTVIYRLGVNNKSDGSLKDIVLTDTLPLGFKFLPKSLQARYNEKPTPIEVQQNGQVLTLNLSLKLPKDESVTIIYAAQLTPDALRGTGKNYANVDAHRVDNGAEVQDGPAIHKVRLTAGIMSNCGTILGRVFEDRNFDGEQQNGEPGIPNAVVYLEDGNRITTDPDGLFSVKCVLPGYHTGVLDPLSIPDYRLAPNRYRIELNGPSRLVRLAPGGMARMNFAVTPASRSGEKL
ncbi:MAG TPA: hypothetical protein V6D19_14370 [Stenomitos sp.]